MTDPDTLFRQHAGDDERHLWPEPEKNAVEDFIDRAAPYLILLGILLACLTALAVGLAPHL